MYNKDIQSCLCGGKLITLHFSSDHCVICQFDYFVDQSFDDGIQKRQTIVLPHEDMATWQLNQSHCHDVRLTIRDLPF